MFRRQRNLLNSDPVGQIGRLSVNPATFTTNWLPGPLSDALPVGALYVDQTGIFNNALVAVTHSTTVAGNVWLIDHQGGTNQLASLSGLVGGAPESVLTLPNDTTKYGPWAGKILIGAENLNQMFTVDTGGVVVGWPIPTFVESLNLIPADQDLYAVDFGDEGASNGRVWKVSRNDLVNYVGDVLVTDEGTPQRPTRHVILHWDGQTFQPIELINPAAKEYEQATFH